MVVCYMFNFKLCLQSIDCLKGTTVVYVTSSIAFVKLWKQSKSHGLQSEILC